MLTVDEEVRTDMMVSIDKVNTFVYQHVEDGLEIAERWKARDRSGGKNLRNAFSAIQRTTIVPLGESVLFCRTAGTSSGKGTFAHNRDIVGN